MLKEKAGSHGFIYIRQIHAYDGKVNVPKPFKQGKTTFGISYTTFYGS